MHENRCGTSIAAAHARHHIFPFAYGHRYIEFSKRKLNLITLLHFPFLKCEWPSLIVFRFCCLQLVFSSS